MSNTTTLVDSCVLLDMINNDPTWGTWSSNEIRNAANAGTLVINPLIYSEVSVQYVKPDDVDAVLPPTDFIREDLPYEAGFLAGKAFLKYRRSGGLKTSPLPDFYIGAHAQHSGYRLLTRDANRYRTYFPSVTLIVPPTS